MQVDKASEAMMEELGLHPLGTSTGLTAFNQALQAKQAQMLVVEGNLRVLRNTHCPARI
jgi:hypothetical protein